VGKSLGLYADGTVTVLPVRYGFVLGLGVYVSVAVGN